MNLMIKTDNDKRKYKVSKQMIGIENIFNNYFKFDSCRLKSPFNDDD